MQLQEKAGGEGGGSWGCWLNADFHMDHKKLRL